MFIQTEATPNPATLKFIPGKDVLADGTADFRSKGDAAASPLATRLFAIDGVDGVFLGSDFISVTKGDIEWQHLKPMVLGAIMEHYMSGAPVTDEEDSNDSAAGKLRSGGRSNRRDDQGAARDARASGRRPGRRRHHVLGLPRRRRLSCTCAAPARAARVRRPRSVTASKTC